MLVFISSNFILNFVPHQYCNILGKIKAYLWALTAGVIQHFYGSALNNLTLLTIE